MALRDFGEVDLIKEEPCLKSLYATKKHKKRKEVLLIFELCVPLCG